MEQHTASTATACTALRHALYRSPGPLPWPPCPPGAGVLPIVPLQVSPSTASASQQFRLLCQVQAPLSHGVASRCAGCTRVRKYGGLYSVTLPAAVHDAEKWVVVHTGNLTHRRPGSSLQSCVVSCLLLAATNPHTGRPGGSCETKTQPVYH